MFLLFHFSEFRSGKAPILVATDVASRGLGMKWDDREIIMYFIFLFFLFTGLMKINILVLDVIYPMKCNLPSIV